MLSLDSLKKHREAHLKSTVGLIPAVKLLPCSRWWNVADKLIDYEAVGVALYFHQALGSISAPQNKNNRLTSKTDCEFFRSLAPPPFIHPPSSLIQATILY